MPTRGHGRALQVEGMPMTVRSWTRDGRFPAIGKEYKQEGRERHVEMERVGL